MVKETEEPAPEEVWVCVPGDETTMPDVLVMVTGRLKPWTVGVEMLFTTAT